MLHRDISEESAACVSGEGQIIQTQAYPVLEKNKQFQKIQLLYSVKIKALQHIECHGSTSVSAPRLGYPSPHLPLPSPTPPLAEQQFTDDNLGLMFGLGRGCSDSDTKSSSMFQGCCSSGYCIHMSYLVNKSLTLHVILGCPSKVSCCKLHKICFHHSFNHSFKFCQL